MTDCVVTRTNGTDDGAPCLQRGVHAGHCPGDTCTGCAPAPAVPGTLVCADDTNALHEALSSFVEHWPALGDLPRTSSGGGPIDDNPSVLPGAVAARTLIRSTLVAWCKVLENEHGVPLPEERLVARWTQLEVLRTEWDRDVALQAARHYQRAGQDDRRRAELDTAKRHTRIAADLRERRYTDTDVIDALREHIDRHLRLLLAPGRAGADSGYPQAQTFAEDVLDVASRARAVAHAHTAPIRVECDCGARVPLDTDRERRYRCPGCGTELTLDGWQQQLAPSSTKPITLRELPAWLLAHHRLEVTLDQVRSWARGERALIRPTTLAGRDEDTGRIIPAKFDPVAVAEVARQRLTRKAG